MDRNSDRGNELGCGFILFKVIIDVLTLSNLHWMFTRFKVYLLLFHYQRENSPPDLIMY